MRSLRRKILGASFAALATVFVATPSWAQQKLRIALETNPAHVRNKGVDLFVEELKKRTGDHFVIEVYPSGQLFRDRDIPRALRQGSLEMGVPGIWHLDSTEPNAALVTLPMFYGVDVPTVNKVMDGDLGNFLNRKFEERMRVKIPGKWMILGMQHTFGVSEPIDYQTYKGKKIRYPGGTGNAARIDRLGGVGVLIPWPDVPMAMSQGIIGGLLTTYESVATSKLMDAGVRHVFEDGNMVSQYVPLISESFWRKQPENVKAAILEAWDIAATWERGQAEKAQQDAKDSLVAEGIQVIVPTKEEVTTARKHLMPIQDQLIESMKIDKEVAQRTYEALKAAGVEY